MTAKNESKIGTCSFCIPLIKEIEEHYAQVPEERRLREVLTDFSTISSGQECQKHYLCAPLSELRLRIANLKK